ncbi:MAG: hypothetical protein Q9160_008425 [Pyrenula sp. 1 TL-2023]
MLSFVVTHNKSPTLGPRLGDLRVASRCRIQTPHYVATTSRGVVPHVTPDLVCKHSKISSVYVALEDFLERSHQKKAPIIAFSSFEDKNDLREFIGLQDDVLVVCGPRRIPPVPCSAHSTNTAIPIITSAGFQQLELESYNEALQDLRPDIAVALADIDNNDRPGRKRIERSADRTHAWLRDTLAERGCANGDHPDTESALFASVLPFDREQQSFYITDLANDFRPSISGLVISTPSSAATIPPTCRPLPRLCVYNPPTPHAILDAISSGADLLTLPLVNSCSDAGQAFTFTFPSPPSNPASEPFSVKLPLAIDLWSSTSHYSTSLSPISSSCSCYTCTRHHLAFIHHLLNAKEMLAWTLLQLHNHAAINAFFTAIRTSIATDTFQRDVQIFAQAYETEMPVKVGQGPRTRGYETKSVGRGEARLNVKAYGRFDERVEAVKNAGESRSQEGEEAVGLDGGSIESLVDKLEESGVVERA